MSKLVKTTIVEGKLFLREPMSVGFGVLFPAGLLLLLGAIPALREPSPDFDGARFVEFWAPTALVIGMAILGVQHIPTVLATYREQGVLRRLSTTPVHPAQVLVAQLIVVMLAMLVGTALLVGSAWLVLDVPLPDQPLLFLAAFLVGFGAVLALGLLVAAVAPNARAATGFGTVVFMLIMFAGGVYLPRFLMPDFLVRLGDYTPPGVQALLETWSGDLAALSTVESSAAPPLALQLGIMALVAVVASTAAARLFRWE
ncbi:MAG TPA: ABC transporter permease [Natronosporangium sp.]